MRPSPCPPHHAVRRDLLTLKGLEELDAEHDGMSQGEASCDGRLRGLDLVVDNRVARLGGLEALRRGRLLESLLLGVKRVNEEAIKCHTRTFCHDTVKTFVIL